MSERPLDLLIRRDGTVLRQRTNGEPTWQVWDWNPNRWRTTITEEAPSTLPKTATIVFRRVCKLDSGRWVYEETP